MAIINISDHFTRTKAQKKPLEVCGGLLGTIKDNQIEIVTSFELCLKDEKIDQDYFNFKRDQYKQTFGSLEVLGWYGIPSLKKLHSDFCLLIQAAIFLEFDPNVQDSLPFKAFDTLDLVELKVSVETFDSERIAVTHVVSNASRDQLDLKAQDAEFLSSERNALQMLISRLEIVENYLRMVDAGHPADPAIVRDISSLVWSMPQIHTSLKNKLDLIDRDYTTACQVLEMSSSLAKMHDLIEKMNQSFGSERIKLY